MTRELLKTLPDAELDQVEIWTREEKRERASRHKQETIARIRELAAGVGVPIKIGAPRGRPAKSSPEQKSPRSK
jgi:hypothetical protein